MEGLRVNGKLVTCNRLGRPLVSSFLLHLFPGPSGREDRERALGAWPFDYIEDLPDYVNRVARKTQTDREWINDQISFPRASREGNEVIPTTKKRPAPTIVVVDDEDLFEDEDDDNNSGEYQQQEEEEEEEDVVEDYDDDDEEMEEMEEVDVPPGEAGGNVQGGNVGGNAVAPSNSLAENVKVVRAFSLLIANTDRVTEPDYHRLLKDTLIPFIGAIRQHGPVLDAQHAQRVPEQAGERLFGVSQRIEALGANVPEGRAGVIGKRALELYRKVYPGCTPPQRVMVCDDDGKERLMNQYSETTARKTLDVAIGEFAIPPAKPPSAPLAGGLQRSHKRAKK